MNELEEILLDQLHAAQRQRKRIKRMIRIMPHEPLLREGEIMVTKRIQFYETMIQDKSLLHKKVKKKKKEKDPDILARGIFREWYRNAYVLTKVSYNIMSKSVQTYMSFFSNKKGKD